MITTTSLCPKKYEDRMKTRKRSKAKKGKATQNVSCPPDFKKFLQVTELIANIKHRCDASTPPAGSCASAGVDIEIIGYEDHQK
jgi:hypothetical protein